MAHTIRIAMLNTDIPVPAVHFARGTYGNIFHKLLTAALPRISSNNDITIDSIDYDVRNFEYPPSNSNIDVVLITGSASSAYDDEEWIKRLDDYVLDLYINHPHVKMFGSCFGHQLICQSLLRGEGVVVEKDPKGWEIGVKEVNLTEEFRKALQHSSLQSESSMSTSLLKEVPSKLRLQFVHADHVVLPSGLSSLPHSWVMLGSTSHCAVQGVYQPGRILTLQGHFEFDRFVNTETLKVFGAKWDPEVLKQTLEACASDDDAEVAADMVTMFLFEGGSRKRSRRVLGAGGLLTPPEEEVT
ncbi:class I glutamine amidotransferase-like protein [Pleomassaria siparia CBS 279.74]|uniref:Class I glutamine amidotransferase-like protein n=1 Tax=Pleomassaria siparia CBS 279.74 TaxID=1314801 RepID=A0A6G1KC07_9PLEO|nr:class I glutamine amidotransferase-like protein [Pleomassaria siparia CBS 279.74]